METINNTQPDSLKEVENLLIGYTEKPIVNTETESTKKRGRKPKNFQPEPEPEQLQTIGDNPMLSGSMIILMIDLIIPNLICFAGNRFTKKKIKPQRLQMTSKQREELEPIAEKVAQQMALKANPMAVLIISLLGIYGVNFMSQMNE